MASYDKAIALKPDYAEAFNNRGLALESLRRFEDAVESYDKALALKPDYAHAFYNRGNVLVSTTERDRELVADLAAERRCLGKAQMMGIGGAAATNEARLLGYRFDVVAVTEPPGCR